MGRLSQNVGKYLAIYASQNPRTKNIQSLFFLTSVHNAQCQYTVWAERRILRVIGGKDILFVHKILLLYLAYIYEIIREIYFGYIPYTALISEDYTRARTHKLNIYIFTQHTCVFSAIVHQIATGTKFCQLPAICPYHLPTQQ